MLPTGGRSRNGHLSPSGAFMFYVLALPVERRALVRDISSSNISGLAPQRHWGHLCPEERFRRPTHDSGAGTGWGGGASNLSKLLPHS